MDGFYDVQRAKARLEPSAQEEWVSRFFIWVLCGFYVLLQGFLEGFIYIYKRKRIFDACYLFVLQLLLVSSVLCYFHGTSINMSLFDIRNLLLLSS